MFITFEGIDGSGKTSLIPLIADWLERQGREVVCTREPGGTDSGERIRFALEWHCNKKTAFLLYLADRAEHVEKVIRPALAKGQIVLCDRYIDSTYAYQPDYFPIHKGCAFASGGLMPNLTILLDVSAETAAKRIYQRGENPPDLKELEDLKDIRRKYQDLWRADPYRIKAIDAEKPASTVYNEVIKVIQEAGLGL